MSKAKNNLIIIFIFNYFIGFSQVITKHDHAYKYKQVETNYSYSYDVINNKDSFYIESKYYNLKEPINPRIKVGIQFNYFPSGIINQIGYYGTGIDTFSIDSNSIIIFNNPNPNYHLINSSKTIENTYNSKSENNGYSIEIIPTNWNIEFDSSGNIISHCVEENNSTVVIK